MTESEPPPDDNKKKLPAGIKRVGPNRYDIRVQARDPRSGMKLERRDQFVGTKAAAIARQAELRGELRANGRSRPRVRLRAFASTWLASRTLRPSTQAKYVSNLDHHILPELGDLFVDSILPADIRAFITKKSGELAANTVINMLRLLRAIARDAQADGETKIYFCDRVEAPRAPGYSDEDPNLLSAPELARLLAVIPKRWLPLVLLLAYTGMRWAEVSGLRWEDLDLAAGEIQIRRSNWRGIEGLPKTRGSKRSLPLPQRVVELLQSQSSGLVFPTTKGPRRGKARKSNPLGKVLDKACTAAGVTPITTHGLRRTFNDLGRQVADRLVVKSLVGHTTDAMHEHYSRVRMVEKTAAQQTVLALVEGPQHPPSILPVAREMFEAFHGDELAATGTDDAGAAARPDFDDLGDEQRDAWIRAAIAARPDLRPLPALPAADVVVDSAANNREAVKSARAERRALGVCENNADHGAAVKGGRCQRCWDKKLAGERKPRRPK